MPRPPPHTPQPTQPPTNRKETKCSKHGETHSGKLGYALTGYYRTLSGSSADNRSPTKNSKPDTEKTTMTDMMNNPPHYKSGGMEAIDVIEAFFHSNSHLTNTFKYIAQAGKKNDHLEDYMKAHYYPDREIERTRDWK